MRGRSEKSILNDTLLEVSALPDSLFYRNNTGMAWQGKRGDYYVGEYIKVERDMVVLHDARPVHFGLVGSGDIMGAYANRPVAIETKTLTGRQEQQQRLFEVAWRKAGGIYILSRSPEEAVPKLLLGYK